MLLFPLISFSAELSMKNFLEPRAKEINGQMDV